jgi:hypothetical protein
MLPAFCSGYVPSLTSSPGFLTGFGLVSIGDGELCYVVNDYHCNVSLSAFDS